MPVGDAAIIGWQKLLEFGEYASLEDLVKDVGLPRRSGAKTGVDRTYIGRLVTAKPKAKTECST